MSSMTSDQLLERCRKGDEDALQILTEEYHGPVYSLLVNLLAGHRDQAYELTVTAFKKTLKEPLPHESEIPVLTELAASALAAARSVQVIPSVFPEGSGASEGKLTPFLKEALAMLPFDTRALILLRDMLHFSEQEIVFLLPFTRGKIRIELETARLGLRKKMEALLENGN